MCGISGIYNYDKSSTVQKNILYDMNQALEHRGPDGSGLYIDQFIGFGHRRLSIIDLQNGKQPMSNENNTIWVTYNGEIYNFKELKAELVSKGHHFRTDCDTEVIVHCYEEYGTTCISRFNGMFAFALWDQNKEVLFLARDRMGVKPLYYTMMNGSFIFASEIKSIFRHPAVKAEVEIAAVPEYFFCTALLNGSTMFKNIFSLPAGHFAVLKNGNFQISQYWDIIMNQEQGVDSYQLYKTQTYNLLKESVQMRFMSDVPLGSLLSGGLDSSLISAHATRYTKIPIKTFSMEFSRNINQTNSDTTYSRLMADTFRTDHKEFIFDPEDYQSILEKVIWHNEKPVELTTPSLYLLYKNLKEDVTVVLSGEGADELFGGYFFFLENHKAGELQEFPWAPYFQEVSLLLEPDIERETHFRDKIKTTLFDMMNRNTTTDITNKVLYLFLKIYLLEMLERQDKTSMAWGVEARVPFMDYRLVEWAMRIPSKYKIQDGIEKYILKDIGKDILPPAIVERKKKPFPFPVDPKSIYRQKNMALAMVESGNSRISRYFNKQRVYDFFNKRNGFEKTDSLAIFRTSYAMIALELWHKAFGV